MRQWGNFYFWSTWLLLTCLFTLIFHMYLSEFNLKEIIDTITLYFIDVKTILTVLGTIFGAYFGAKTAGKYAIESVERQIQAQEKKENEKENNKFLRYLNVFITHLESILIVDSLLKRKFDFDSDIIIKKSSIDIAKEEINDQLTTLKKLDITEMKDQNYHIFLFCLLLIKHYLESLDYILKYLADSQFEEVKLEFIDLKEHSSNLEKHLDTLKGILSKYNG